VGLRDCDVIHRTAGLPHDGSVALSGDVVIADAAPKSGIRRPQLMLLVRAVGEHQVSLSPLDE